MSNTGDTLRPYQVRAIAETRAAFQQGARSVCMVSPTGSGKTRIAAELVNAESDGGARVLWLTHRKELVDQSARRVPWATVRSIQGLLGGDRPAADFVVLDEAHHFVAPEWFRVAQDYAGARILGLTATPERKDGTALGNLFDRMVVVAQVPELVRGGWLVPTDLWAPAARLRGIVDPVKCWREQAEGMRTVVYCGTVKEAHEYAERWPVPAAAIDGEMPMAERESAIARFASGEIKVLTNVYVLTEGWDVPGIECVVLARGFGSVSAYLQAIGRARRPAPDKRRALVLDLKGSVHIHGLPDDVRNYSLNGDAIKNTENPERLQQCENCGAVVLAAHHECPRCGEPFPLPEPRRQEVVRNYRLELIKAIMAEHTPEKKAATLAELQETARVRGYKPGWASVQYKMRYGHWPRTQRRGLWT